MACSEVHGSDSFSLGSSVGWMGLARYCLVWFQPRAGEELLGSLREGSSKDLSLKKKPEVHV